MALSIAYQAQLGCSHTDRSCWSRSTVMSSLVSLVSMAKNLSKWGDNPDDKKWLRWGYTYLIVYYSDNEEKMKHILAKCGLKSVEKIMDFVLKKGDPASVSQTYGSVVLCQKENTLHLSIYKGFHFEVESLEDGLHKMLMMFFVLWIDYPNEVRTFFNFLAKLHGKKVTVSTTMGKLCKQLNSAEWTWKSDYRFDTYNKSINFTIESLALHL